MKRTLFRWGAAVSTSALLIGLLVVPAQAAWDPPACPWGGELAAGSYVVDLAGPDGYKYIRSDRRLLDADTARLTLTAPIPAGTYDITLFSYDDHNPDKAGQTQPNEQWFVTDGSFRSGTIGDLADDANTILQQVDTGASVPELTELWAHHAYYSSGAPTPTPNSITPICALFAPHSSPPPPPPTTTTTTSPLVGSIGNFVWNDANTNGIQDADEVGVAGVAVNLLDGSGTLLASTSTDADGYYRFGGLLAGDYVVEFVAPVDWEFSPADQGSDDAIDSDAGVAGRSGVISLAAGAGELTIDAGMHRTTEVEPTTAVRPTEETLPFTGASSSGMGGAAIGLVLLGGLVLLAVRGKEDTIARHRAR